jgi:drug/metabolite transporter (DMT)-like permease
MKATSVWVMLALLAASIEPILVKLGYRGAVTPLQLLLMKNVVGATVILPLTRHFRLPGVRDAGRIASVSLLLLLTNGLTLYALQRLTAVTVITVVTTTPALVALANQALGRDRLGPRFWLGFGICFAGIVLTVDAAGADGYSLDPLGLGIIALAVLSSTLYRVRMEELTGRYDPRLVSTWVFWINAAVAVLFLAPFLEPIPAEALPLGLWIGLAAALANVAFLWAIKLVGSTNMSIFNLIQRPLVIVAAALVLREPLTLSQALGVAMVLAGLPLARATRRNPAAQATPDRPRSGLPAPSATR